MASTTTIPQFSISFENDYCPGVDLRFQAEMLVASLMRNQALATEIIGDALPLALASPAWSFQQRFYLAIVAEALATTPSVHTGGWTWSVTDVTFESQKYAGILFSDALRPCETSFRLECWCNLVGSSHHRVSVWLWFLRRVAIAASPSDQSDTSIWLGSCYWVAVSFETVREGWQGCQGRRRESPYSRDDGEPVIFLLAMYVLYFVQSWHGGIRGNNSRQCIVPKKKVRGKKSRRLMAFHTGALSYQTQLACDNNHCCPRWEPVGGQVVLGCSNPTAIFQPTIPTSNLQEILSLSPSPGFSTTTILADLFPLSGVDELPVLTMQLFTNKAERHLKTRPLKPFSHFPNNPHQRRPQAHILTFRKALVVQDAALKAVRSSAIEWSRRLPCFKQRAIICQQGHRYMRTNPRSPIRFNHRDDYLSLPSTGEPVEATCNFSSASSFASKVATTAPIFRSLLRTVSTCADAGPSHRSQLPKAAMADGEFEIDVYGAGACAANNFQFNHRDTTVFGLFWISPRAGASRDVGLDSQRPSRPMKSLRSMPTGPPLIQFNHGDPAVFDLF
ncbi:hypothetical protein QBC42DRAFT_247861 [Cladorrhinum samala]|uniref:Uncharacterized protein n=1 Tax=Cladorrhinum samala TaxID=585594 RepID=A0AAV9HZD8_9PEZI|nr:hypothetical protein QBC42DRAFT_247861 [Cladorrhinum samala]